MTDETELRLASDSFLARLERLHDLESEKRLLTPGTDRMVALAAEVEEIVREVLGDATKQLEFSERASTTGGLRPIEAIPPREAPEILADWREAERRMTAADPGSADEALARTDIERLRDEYSRAFEMRRQA